MKHFVGIRLVARTLDEYVGVFTEINKRRDEFPLSDFLQPRASSHFSRGGLAPPSLERVLGIGACFVVRELVRSGFLTTPGARRYCYAPHRSVRRLLCHPPVGVDRADLDGSRPQQSAAIYRFLCDHLGEKD